ncbi:MAG TPA: DNA primase [Euryarchaeota archaeon]|nr:DNA primase [Euryarchaeota archaeon]
MGKIDLDTTKYVIHSKIETNGVVEKPDVVGAIFGQTEGLLGNDLDLRELQKTGRIGRIEVEISTAAGKSKGTVKIPSSLDRVETAILAAALETIDRVGPCESHISVEKIEDVRVSKRKKLIGRAKNILETMIDDITPDSIEITEEVKESLRMKEIQNYGIDKLPAGPNIDNSDAIIVVEGRADVLLMLKYGIKNAIAVEGTSIPKIIVELSKKKTVTAFTDGDRGGELILRELLQVGEIDFVGRAPEGKEVEELTKKEIFKALRNKVPAEQVMEYFSIPKREEAKPFSIKKTKRPSAPPHRNVAEPKVVEPKEEENNEMVEKFKKFFTDLKGTLKAYLLDQEGNIIKEVAVRDLASALNSSREKVNVVIFDGIITQRLSEIAAEKGVDYLIGDKIGNLTKKPAEIRLLSSNNLGLN